MEINSERNWHKCMTSCKMPQNTWTITIRKKITIRYIRKVQLSLYQQGIDLATPPPPTDTRLHRCSSSSYKTVAHPHSAFTHLPKYFKSSLDNLYHKIQWNCQINIYWCTVNSSFCFLEFSGFVFQRFSVGGWLNLGMWSWWIRMLSSVC